MSNGARSLLPVCETYEQFGDDGLILRDAGPISVPTLDDVIGFEPLWVCMELCKRGVTWKDSVASFLLNAVERIARMSEELYNGTYRHGKTTTFTVMYPKRRVIVAQTFRDRIYHRSIVENLLVRYMFPSLIYDNAACQKGKGTDFARNRLRRFLREHYAKYGTAGYILLMDVEKYYDSMLHSAVEWMFASMLPDWGAAMVVDALRAHYPGERGYNPGSSIVQVAGVSLLNGIDHHIKERCGIRGYTRYMDDFRVISNDLATLERCRDDVGMMLADLGMSLHPRKTRIVPITEAVSYLGFDFRLMSTGKVTMTLDSQNVRNMRRRITGLARLETKGLRPAGTTDQSFECWLAHASKGDSKQLVRNNERWYRGLRNAD